MTLAAHPASATGPSVPWPPGPTGIPSPHTGRLPNRLTSLAALSRRSLQERFAAASAPHDLSLLVGEPACLGLLPGGQAVARWAASENCPWIGKSFHLAAPDLLVGHNRLRLFGGARALAFEGALGTSIVDCRPSLILRYDTPGNTNPWWQRRFHDELREIERGLLAGPVMWLGRGSPRPICWFAIDTGRP